MTTASTASSQQGDLQPDPGEFHRHHDLDKVLADTRPLESISELQIRELADVESDAFLEAIEA